ncbi:MAG: type II secretion system protein [Candidatus Marinimicrobia bacterium]|nr:type II secretion system protein [Candidatus Neomarinimicrobiota bacterium]
MKINIKNNQSGFSLIELVLGIVVVSIALVGAMVSLSNIEAKSVHVEIVNRGTNYASNIMETIINHRFDENIAIPWSADLGPEESAFTEYDDIDDYHSLTWTSPTLPGYSGTSFINYVIDTDWLNNNPNITSYKTVTVVVTHSVLDIPIVIKSLVTSGILTF